MVSVPLSAAIDCGVKDTLSAHDWPAANENAVLVQEPAATLKSPLHVTPVTAALAVPVFVMVSAMLAEVDPTAVAGKASAAGVTDIAACGALVPLPLSATVVGLPLALPVIVNEAAAVPVVAGAN